MWMMVRPNFEDGSLGRMGIRISVGSLLTISSDVALTHLVENLNVWGLDVEYLNCKGAASIHTFSLQLILKNFEEHSSGILVTSRSENLKFSLQTLCVGA